MRVISGKYRGKKLITIDGNSTRPTTDRVKESIFNLIQFDISNSKVLDLFSGSGGLGIECLSRGASSVDFNDYNPKCVDIIRKNLADIKGNYTISNRDYIQFLDSVNAPNYDLILVDAPYNMDIALDLQQQFTAKNILKIGGLVVFETDKEIECTQSFDKIKNKKYGITYVTVIERTK